jgi:hypothetical protein
MEPVKNYYVVAVGGDEGEMADIHYFNNHLGEKVLFVFSSPREAMEFLVKQLEGDPQAYMDMLESGISVPEGLTWDRYRLLCGPTETIAIFAAKVDADMLILDVVMQQGAKQLALRLPKA